MDSLFDFGSMDHRAFTSSPDLNHELITSLTSFTRVYGRHRDRLQRSSRSFTLTTARLRETHEDESKTVRVAFAVVGGALGGACGVFTGGVWGVLGAVGAATCVRICGNINAVGATVGFVGSVCGGVAGGLFCGAVGGAVGAAARGPAHAAVSDVAWFTVGFATGGAVGGIFGGTVGAAGGAVGGALGGVCATRFAGALVGGVAGRCRGTEDSKEQKKKETQESGADFREAIEPVVDELKTVKYVCDKMASGVFVHSVAAQTARTLASVTTMEKTLGDSQTVTDLPQFVSSIEEAATQSRKITEQLETTSEEAEKLLVSLKKN